VGLFIQVFYSVTRGMTAPFCDPLFAGGAFFLTPPRSFSFHNAQPVTLLKSIHGADRFLIVRHRNESG
jgi:hypothetical protein